MSRARPPQASPAGRARGGKPAKATASRNEPSARPTRVRRSPEEARATILEAARELIAERGPDAVGLKDIGAAAGVSHALVVHYFGGYEPLVQAVLQTGIQRFRALMLERLSEPGPLDPSGWIALVFDELRSSTAGRLVLWALLTRRLDGPDAYFRREQGLRLVCDALEQRLRAVFGEAAPDRETLELTLVLGIAASWGYALGGHALWGALGHEPGARRDREVRDRLGQALLQSALAARATQPPGRSTERRKS